MVQPISTNPHYTKNQDGVNSAKNIAANAAESRHIDINRAGEMQYPNQIRQSALERAGDIMKSVGKGALKVVGGTVGGVVVGIPALGVIGVGWVAKSALMLPPLLVAGLRDALHDVQQDRNTAENIHNQLGQAVQDGILSQDIEEINGISRLRDIMNNYREQLGSKLLQPQMETYINMGERILHALDQEENYTGGSITVNGPNNMPIQVSPNLDSARAISWYLQAKAVADNAGDRDAVTMNRGSMVLEDPGNKLFNFLNSSPNAYGRASTHFNERSTEKAGYLNTGLAGGTINVYTCIRNALFRSGKPMQAAQHGIEDFSSKFPSGKGCLLFDKLDGNDNTQQLFLKWESAGMPNFVNPTATHADAESGWVGKVCNRFGAYDRCIAHTLNFMKLGKSAGNWGLHRESVKKAEVENVNLLKQFSKLMKSIELADGKNENWASNITKEAKLMGTEFMANVIDGLAEQYGDQVPNFVQHLQDDLHTYNHSHGVDLGIIRKGAEVHVQLPTGALNEAIANRGMNHLTNQPMDRLSTHDLGSLDEFPDHITI